jgi:glycosyltransferase involved in cell wall biosynthesis
LFVGNYLDSSVGTRAVSEDLYKRFAAEGWSVRKTSGVSNKLLRLADMLRTAFFSREEYQTAVVDVFSGPAFRFAESVCWMLRRLNKPYVLTLHGGNLPAFARMQPARVARLLNSAAHVTTPSRYLTEQMKPYRSDLTLIPNPIKIANYPYRRRSAARPNLVWLRAMHQTYNPILALEAIELLVAEFPSIHLTMAGPDKGDGTAAQVQQEIVQRKLSDHVTLLGPVAKSEVPAKLAEADIFINTTNVDNTPVSVLEAMACGLCVVSTNVGGIPYLLDDEVDGLLIQPREPRALAAAIRRILTEPELAQRLSENAHRKASQFDWNEVLPQWVKLLTQPA